MSGVKDQKPPVSIKSISWDGAQLFSAMGSYALIYRVAPGVVAKVGLVERQEVELQQRVAETGRALPVWDYEERIAVPSSISETFCSEHGNRSLPDDMVSCSCGEPLSILLMPEANLAIWKHFDALSIAEFMEEVSTYCLEEFDFSWDCAERNLAIHQGHLVALDFGDAEEHCS